MTRIALIALAVAFALALPASAMAQSAGDNQYQDPLATPHGNSSSGSSGSSGSGSSTPAPSQSSGSSGSSGTAGTTSSSGTAGATATSSGLPRTGGHPELIALLGVALLGGGFGLRRLLQPRTG
jgi:hypothetical protein